MPTTPTLHTIRGSAGAPSSPPRLPPPRNLTRTTPLPPPPAPPINFNMDGDPFNTNAEATATHDRSRRRPNQAHLPPAQLEQLGLSSSDEEDPVMRRMEEGVAYSMARRGQPSIFQTQPYHPVSHPTVESGSEVEESTLDPVEAAQMQADAQEDTEADEGDTGDTEEAEVEAETADEEAMEIDNTFDLTGLKEIGNLACWTVSTCKPGSGVEALRHDDTHLFWQSDGPQPHHLNIHFSRLVSILSIRIFLDFEADESYTPTKLLFVAGTGYHDLIPFQQLAFDQPKGWIDVPLSEAGGGPQGNELRCFLVQLRIIENHQNGKDTHVRGLKIYARDERQAHKEGLGLHDRLSLGDGKAAVLERIKVDNDGGHLLAEPDWMGEAELR